MSKALPCGLWLAAVLLNLPLIGCYAAMLFGERSVQLSGFTLKPESVSLTSLGPLLVTLALATLATVLSVVPAMLCAYVAERSSRLQRFSSAFRTSNLLLYMIPPVAILPSALWTMRWLREQMVWMDNWYLPFFTVAVLNAVFCWPYSLWLSARFMAKISPRLEEYAQIEGCGFARTFWHAVWPQLKRPLTAVAVFAFAIAANDFVFAGTFLNAEGSRTVTVEVVALMSSEERAIRDIYFQALLLHAGVELIAYYAITAIDGSGAST